MAILDAPINDCPLVKNYIDGEFVDPQGEIKDVVNPVNGEAIAKVAVGTRNDFDLAVEAAKEAHHDWRRTPPVSRARCLFRLKELMEENFEELSRVQTQEHGKTIDESRGETRRGIENVEVACGIPTLMMGDTSEDIASGIDEYLLRVPLGVFGIIGPFNFPFMIPLWSAPYAVATGNTIVIKPSSEVPVTQMKVAELAEEAGFPPGVWNVVNGGREVVSGMIENPDVQGLTFVGSTPTARDVIYPGCGSTGKRVIAQGGAANLITVMPDCNINGTVRAMLTSFFGNAGQRCLAGQTLIIVGGDKFYNEFMDEMRNAAKNIIIGNGLDESVQMGPVRDPQKKANILSYIECAEKEGAKISVDGRKPKIKDGYPETCFLGATIMENVPRDSCCIHEEIFGPTMSVIRAKDLDQALEISNENCFQNGNAIFTASGRDARKFQYESRSGNIGINVGVVAPMAFFPFSGAGDSFYGILHTQGKEAVRFFTGNKVCIHRWM